MRKNSFVCHELYDMGAHNFFQKSACLEFLLFILKFHQSWLGLDLEILDSEADTFFLDYRDQFFLLFNIFLRMVPWKLYLPILKNNSEMWWINFTNVELFNKWNSFSILKCHELYKTLNEILYLCGIYSWESKSVHYYPTEI